MVVSIMLMHLYGTIYPGKEIDGEDFPNAL